MRFPNQMKRYHEDEFYSPKPTCGEEVVNYGAGYAAKREALETGDRGRNP